MSNITSNRVSAEIDETELVKINEYLDSINTAMPFLVGLTVDERVGLPKVNDSNKTFVEDAINAIANNGHMLPAYFQAKEMSKDINLFKQLDGLSLRVGQLNEKINDTLMLAGSEAYVTALTAYRLFNAAAIAGIPGADTVYDKLQVRFADQGNFKKTEPVQTTATATEAA